MFIVALLTVILFYYFREKKIINDLIREKKPPDIYASNIITFFTSKNFNTYIDYINQYKLINKIPNIYLPDEDRVKSQLLWINHKKDSFTQINWPNTINFDAHIKQDILNLS